jgi:hypothetical protein
LQFSVRTLPRFQFSLARMLVAMGLRALAGVMA